MTRARHAHGDRRRSASWVHVARWLALLVCQACAGEGGRATEMETASAAADAASAAADAASAAADAAAPSDVTDAGLDAQLHDAAPERDAALDLTGLPELCGRPGADAVRDVFCVPGAPARFESLRALQAALDLNAIPLDMDEATAAKLTVDPQAFLDGFVFLGHSTALSGRLVSALNPRALLLGRRAIMAFQRGVQQVEIISLDRNDNDFNFYLVSFRQACNERATGCAPGDLYTPQVERDWKAVELRDDEDLKNTPSDCRQCHQRGLKRPMLLMRELNGPWTHFFVVGSGDPSFGARSGGAGHELVRTFQQAKAGEIYAGIPAVAMGHTAGLTLENTVTAAQPVLFPSQEIESELAAHDPASGPRRSPTWDAAYQAFKRGEQLALPYFETNPADPDKQAQLVRAYQRYRSGELGAEQLPDLSDVFPDDPQARAEIGLSVEPDAAPAQALITACGQCHNDVLDQSISRARFNVALSRMSRDELELAIERMERPPEEAGAMPPLESRQLTDAVRARLITYLRLSVRPAGDDVLLDQAAAMGMAKERWPGMRYE
jgi:hypothetical protein